MYAYIEGKRDVMCEREIIGMIMFTLTVFLFLFE